MTVVWDDGYLALRPRRRPPAAPGAARADRSRSPARSVCWTARRVELVAPRPGRRRPADPGARPGLPRRRPARPGGPVRRRARLRHPGQPRSSRGMYEASALIAGGSVLAAERVWAGQARHAVNIAGGLHHAMRDRASGFCVFNDAAIAIAWLLAARRRAGRLRRRRRPPRRRRAGRVLRRPAGADGQPPPDAADALPGHRLPGRDRAAATRPAPRSTSRCPAGTGRRRLAAGLRRRRPGRAARLPAAGAGHPVRLRHPPRGPAGRPRAHRRRPARLATGRCTSSPHELCDGRWIALGGGGYGLVRCVPRAWTHLLAEAAGARIDPRTPVPDGLASTRCAAAGCAPRRRRP